MQSRIHGQLEGTLITECTNICKVNGQRKEMIDPKEGMATADRCRQKGQGNIQDRRDAGI